MDHSQENTATAITPPPTIAADMTRVFHGALPKPKYTDHPREDDARFTHRGNRTQRRDRFGQNHQAVRGNGQSPADESQPNPGNTVSIEAVAPPIDEQHGHR